MTYSDTKPLDKGFNAAVVACSRKILPKGFDVSENAPQSFDDLLGHFHETRRVLVWNGASEKTIYADPEINYAFRAWHDAHHILLRAPFTLEGEVAVCQAQQLDIRRFYGFTYTANRYCHIIEGEVVAQRLYADKHGEFPPDQREFVEDWLCGRVSYTNTGGRISDLYSLR